MRSGACLLQHMSTAEPPSARGRATSTLLPVIVALILLPAIALASPPDPSWIAGMYDGGDGDEIVILVYETTAAYSPARSQILPLHGLCDMWVGGAVPCLAGETFARHSRAPPTAVDGVESAPYVSALLHVPCSRQRSRPWRASPQNRPAKIATESAGIAGPVHANG